MSVKIMGMVFDADLPRDEKYILLSYADHAAHDGTSIYPSVGRMAWKTGYSVRSVRSITKKLAEKGILVRDGNGPHNVNRWRIDISKLPTRPDYKSETHEDFAGVQNLQGGGCRICRGRGAEFAPNPSCNRQ